jgi:hypothetical protein
MVARVTTFTADPSRHANAIHIADTKIIPRLQQQPGFTAIYVLVDNQSGDGIVVTLWESDEHEVASRSTAGESFAHLGNILTGPPSPGRVYSVVNEGHKLSTASAGSQ